MPAPTQRIGTVTLSRCTRPEIVGLALAKNVAQIDKAETPYEEQQRVEIARQLLRDMPPSIRRKYTKPVQAAVERIRRESRGGYDGD